MPSTQSLAVIPLIHLAANTDKMTESDSPGEAFLGTEILGLMARFPNLHRWEIAGAVTRCGPRRDAIERELEFLSSQKP